MERNVSRLNPSWASPAALDPMLARFFGGSSSAPVASRPAPVRPAPARELVAC